MRKTFSTLTAASIGSALVFAPMAYGAVEPWAYSVLALVAFTALAAAVCYAAVAAEARALRTWLLVPAVLTLGLLSAQLIKWPADLLESLSPKTVAIHQEADSLAGQSKAEGLTPSLYPHATRDALICIAAYFCLFVAAYAYGRSRENITRIAAVILTVGFAVALLGIAQNLSGTGRLYWWRPLSHGGALFGPFVSKNQFAAYAGVCFFTGLALLLARGAHRLRSPKHWLRDAERAISQRAHQNLLTGFAAAIIAVALLWSLSRGGILAVLLSLAGVLLAISASGLKRTRLLYLAAVAVVVLGCVSYLGWEPIANRFSALKAIMKDPLSTWRWRMWSDAVRMGRDFPVFGTGAGTFFSAYPYYRTIPTPALAHSPHNEYLHVFAETGFAGLALLAITVTIFFSHIIRGLLSQSGTFARGFLAGGIGAPLMIVFHSAVDFPMRSPAIAATLAVVAGLLCRATAADSTHGGNSAKAGGHGKSTPEPPDGRTASARPSTGRILIILAITAAGWFYACNSALFPLRGQLEERTIKRAEQRITPGTGNILAFVTASQKQVETLCPDNAGLYATLADLARTGAGINGDPLTKVRLAEASLRLHTIASRLEPMNARHHLELATDYLTFQRPDIAWQHAERVCELLPNDPWARIYLAQDFKEYGYLPVASHYIEKAEHLATERGIGKVEPLIEEIAREISLAQPTQQSNAEHVSRAQF